MIVYAHTTGAGHVGKAAPGAPGCLTLRLGGARSASADSAPRTDRRQATWSTLSWRGSQNPRGEGKPLRAAAPRSLCASGVPARARHAHAWRPSLIPRDRHHPAGPRMHQPARAATHEAVARVERRTRIRRRRGPQAPWACPGIPAHALRRSTGRAAAPRGPPRAAARCPRAPGAAPSSARIAPGRS